MEKITAILDNDPLNQRLIKDLLSIKNINSEVYSTIASFLETKIAPNILFLDLMLDEGSSARLISIIKDDLKYANTDIIIVSGFSEAEIFDKINPSDIKAIITKPIDMQGFFLKIQPFYEEK